MSNYNTFNDDTDEDMDFDDDYGLMDDYVSRYNEIDIPVVYNEEQY